MSEFYLAWRMEWRHFETVKKIVTGKGVWIEVDRVEDVSKKPKATLELFEDMQKLEWLCWHDGIVGLYFAVAKSNERLPCILSAFGAKEFQQDAEFRYFYKHTIVSPPEVVTFGEFVKRVRLAEEGAACPS